MIVRRIVPDLYGDDPAGSRAFYENVIGLEVAMDLGWIVTYASPSNETAQLSVLSSDATAAVIPHVSVQVDDVDAVYEKAVQHGYEIVHPLSDEPWGVRRFFVRDPNGSVINVMRHTAS